MNNNENIAQPIVTPTLAQFSIVSAISFILLVISSIVLFIWHNPKIISPAYSDITAMAYNTALCMLLSGIALLALIRSNVLLLRICAFIILLISGLTLVELTGGLSVNVNNCFTYSRKGGNICLVGIPKESVTVAGNPKDFVFRY